MHVLHLTTTISLSCAVLMVHRARKTSMGLGEVSMLVCASGQRLRHEDETPLNVSLPETQDRFVSFL